MGGMSRNLAHRRGRSRGVPQWNRESLNISMASEREKESEEERRGPGFLDFRGLSHVAA